MVSIRLVILIFAIGFVTIMVGFIFSIQAARAPVIDPCASPEHVDTSGVKNIAKFDGRFYDRIVCLMDKGVDRKYGIIILVADENKTLLIETLENVHNAENANAAKTLSFVTAKVPIREIPKLADYEFVGLIGDGETKIGPS